MDTMAQRIRTNETQVVRLHGDGAYIINLKTGGDV